MQVLVKNRQYYVNTVWNVNTDMFDTHLIKLLT